MFHGFQGYNRSQPPPEKVGCGVGLVCPLWQTLTSYLHMRLCIYTSLIYEILHIRTLFHTRQRHMHSSTAVSSPNNTAVKDAAYLVNSEPTPIVAENTRYQSDLQTTYL